MGPDSGIVKKDDIWIVFDSVFLHTASGLDRPPKSIRALVLPSYLIHSARLDFNIDEIRALIYRRQGFQARASSVRLQENDLQQASENYFRNCTLTVSPCSPANTQTFSELIPPAQPE